MSKKLYTPFLKELEQHVHALGGYVNGHLHLDRAGTYAATVDLLTQKNIRNGSVLSIAEKHSLIPMIHDSDIYDPKNLEARISIYLDSMVELGTRRADSVVDTTIDRVGMTALDSMLRLKQRYADRLDFQVGAYSPLGFRDDEPERWVLIEQAIEKADFLGLLPERDDKADYPEHCGFSESCRRALLLAEKHKKSIHIHVDQSFHPHEAYSETVVKIVRQLGLKHRQADEPKIWLIHLLSPSTYEDARFMKLATDLTDLGIGVIVCPSSAISMRQLRSEMSPTGNSIARVLELLSANVHVRLGSDNICDISSPFGTPDMMDEIFILANAIRFYDVGVLSHLAAGKPIPKELQQKIQTHLKENQVAIKNSLLRIEKRANFE